MLPSEFLMLAYAYPATSAPLPEIAPEGPSMSVPQQYSWSRALQTAEEAMVTSHSGPYPVGTMNCV